jgi:hypothetical protein
MSAAMSPLVPYRIVRLQAHDVFELYISATGFVLKNLSLRLCKIDKTK